MSNVNKYTNTSTLPEYTIPANPAMIRYLPVLAFAIMLVLGVSPVMAEQTEGDGYAEGGTTACLECHDETADQPVLSIFHTAHGMAGDKNSPEGSLGCESCHGPSAQHVDRPRTEPAISFGPEWISPVEERKAVCMECHAGTDRMHWESSAHDVEDVSCDGCHVTHIQQDPVLDKNQQAETCFECHKVQQAKVNLPSRHPIKEGQTICSDCHNPHGSSTVADLRAPSIVEACVSCHKEKRGPFIFEHDPVAEDCTECHQPHGSAQPSLLINRPPFLCQQCHMTAFHPSQLADGTGLPGGGAPNRNLLGQGCVNCHSKVHGSNHPSGARLTR